MDKSTRTLLRPFIAAYAKPKKPYTSKVKALGNGYIVLENGLKVVAPHSRDIKTGDVITVVEGKVI